jgi:hypothetical protein
LAQEAARAFALLDAKVLRSKQKALANVFSISLAVKEVLLFYFLLAHNQDAVTNLIA